MLNLDYNAGAPLDPRVSEAMAALPAGADGNPSSAHALGRKAKSLLEDARERIAAAIRIQPGEVLFTSGGTEANNLALYGVFRATCLDRQGELWISPIEHPSVSGVLDLLAAQAENVVRLHCAPRGPVQLPPPGSEGFCFVSLCGACGESGILQDIPAFVRAVHARGGLLHCDASQVLGRVAISIFMDSDYVTLSPHKAGGPRGIAVLVRREGRPLAPLFAGGGQEQQLRPGTESVRLAQGAALAIELAVREQEARAHHMRAALDRLLEKLVAGGAEVLTKQRLACLPNTATVVFPGCEARLLMPALDAVGVCTSFGTACGSGARETSKSLLALGLHPTEAKSALRISVGPEFSFEEIDAAAASFHQALVRQASISPPLRRVDTPRDDV